MWKNTPQIRRPSRVVDGFRLSGVLPHAGGRLSSFVMSTHVADDETLALGASGGASVEFENSRSLMPAVNPTSRERSRALVRSSAASHYTPPVPAGARFRERGRMSGASRFCPEEQGGLSLFVP
jgi:hypothetical protein